MILDYRQNSRFAYAQNIIFIANENESLCRKITYNKEKDARFRTPLNL